MMLDGNPFLGTDDVHPPGPMELCRHNINADLCLWEIPCK